MPSDKDGLIEKLEGEIERLRTELKAVRKARDFEGDELNQRVSVLERRLTDLEWRLDSGSR